MNEMSHDEPEVAKVTNRNNDEIAECWQSNW